MHRLGGPILHLRQGTAETWRFTVGIWVQKEKRPLNAQKLKLTFYPAGHAIVDNSPSKAGDLHDGIWLCWNVSIPRRAQEQEMSYRIEGLAERPVEVNRVVIPAIDQAPRLAFFSCNGLQHPEDWTTQPEMERLWHCMRNWDDHEIFDGWGSYDDNLQDYEVPKTIFTAARKAFMLFQLGGGPSAVDSLCLDPQGQHFLQAVPFPGQLDVLLLDLRSQRTKRQVMGDGQWHALKEYLKRREGEAAISPHLLVVSSVPVVYLNFAVAEKFLDWLPWRQELEDDLRDQWESPAHQEERARLIMTLLDHAKVARTRITIVSGDVHIGARGRIISRRPEHLLGQETEVVMHQLTSSAIVYPPPKALTLAGMRAIAKEGPTEISAVSHVETEVLALGARHFLLGKNNWLSIEPDLAWSSSRKQLWVRWITEEGNGQPPLLIRPR